MSKSLYVLDANVFMEAARRYYAFDLALGFWTALVDEANKGNLTSIDKVADEIAKGKDDLSKWSANDFSNYFLSTDNADVFIKYAEIMKWVESQPQFKSFAKAEFAQGADGWLVAFALTKSNATIVTHETYKASVQRQVPIPNVCMAFGISCIDTFGLMRQLGIKL